MRRVQRYEVHDALASGGMATVHLGRLVSEVGFAKLVAVKVMHAQLAADPEFRAMFLDEARTVSRIRHPNVVATLDILEDGGELFLVTEYVHGPSLSFALRASRTSAMPFGVVSRVACDMLEGLHAAHEARAESGMPLGIVHRDVSPHNVLVGADGVSRVMDFGIAVAADRSHATKTGEVKGKAAYMAPEQARGERVDRRADVYAAGTVLYQLLSGRTPFGGGTFTETLSRLLLEPAPSPAALRGDVPFELDAIVLRALSKEPSERFATAREMAEAIASAVAPSSAHEVAAWLRSATGDFFAERDALLARASSSAAALPAKESEVTVREPGSRARPRRWPVALALGVAGLAGAAALAIRPHASEPRSSPAAPVASPMPPPEPGPPPSLVAAAAPEASAPAPSASAEARRKAPTPALGRPSAKPPAAASAPAAAATPSSPPPKCCLFAAGAWQRLSLRPDCLDNCPPGTP